MVEPAGGEGSPACAGEPCELVVAQLLDKHIAKFGRRHRLLARDQLTIDDHIAVPVGYGVHMSSSFGQTSRRVILDEATERARIFEILLFTRREDGEAVASVR